MDNLKELYLNTDEKKVQAKKLVKSNKSKLSNCISGSFKVFPSSKIDFWPYLKLQKMEIDFFGFTSFLPTLFLIFWPTMQRCDNPHTYMTFFNDLFVYF